ncbi:MAG: hypothetical protein ACTHKZ_00080 [Lysobacteraceae bacterium]
MQLEIAFPRGSVLEATYTGQCTIHDRYEAKDAIARAAEGASVRRVMIDLRAAQVEPYGVTDALLVARKVATQSVYGHLAYVLPPGKDDLAAQLLASAHGEGYFRVFRDRQVALDWLQAA